MDKNEVITLSSDDESDSVHRLECNLNSSTAIKPCSKNSSEILKSKLEKFDQSSINTKMGVIFQSNKSKVKVMKLPKIPEKNFKVDIKESPELVDLVDCLDKPNDNSQAQCSNHELSKNMQVNNHSELDIICIDENAFSIEKKSDVDVIMEKETKKVFHDLPLENIKTNEENITSDVINSTSILLRKNNEIEEFYEKIDEDRVDEDSNQNLKFFTEFVEFCGSLEKIPNDRARLTKKLMKRYGEADCSYIKSQEFRNLIQKCKNKVNKYNLYLIAKEITDELSYRKKLEISTTKLNQAKRAQGKFHSIVENNEKIQEISGKRNKNRTKFINKILKNLYKLGNKIRELEIKEVDLSDEEESSYVQLQRYRERFCQIYTKLCKYTNEVADADRFYNRKICFTESKYPTINKCIENWLNKTKTFPDFSDIMKLLESQSSSLGFPSNRESIRMLAMEIFQQVGAMLQRRRMYDLWDSFCGFLDEGEDPANNDPVLDKVLKTNFEARIKKEQEIFQHFAELQEKERLEPEEVPDEEANHSPVDSGNEDYKEIEDIENFLNRKLDDVIKKETEEKGNTIGSNAWDVFSENGNDSENKAQSHHSLKLENTNITLKESKNNFRNCKSLKWRLESCGKMISANSEEGDAGTENEKERETGNPGSDVSKVIKPNNFDSKECKKSEESEKNCSDLDLIVLENTKLNSNEVCSKINAETTGGCLSPSKRAFIVKDENQIPKKKKCTSLIESKSDFEILNINNKNDNSNEKIKKMFNVHWCQIFTNTVFENVNEKVKDYGKRKVFRDLTNVNRLMELHGKRKKMSGLYSPLFFHRSFCEFEKPSWKKIFRMSFRFVRSKDQNCALNQEEKSRKTINSGKDVEKKNIQNNSESGRNDQGESFFSGHGNGREEDNNEDKNKKNGRSTGDVNENQFEEDEDEEENEAEKDENKIDTETAELSFPNKKTEKPLGMNRNSDIPSDIQNNLNENEESIQLSNKESKTSASGSKSENESKNKSENEEKFEKKTSFTGKRPKKESQKNDRHFKKETQKSKVKVSKSENKKDVGNIKDKDEEKHEEMECTKSASKIVRRNSKTDAKNNTTEIEKSTLKRQKPKIENSDVASNEKLNENPDMKIESDTRTQPSTGPSFVEVKDEIELIPQDKRKKTSCRGAEEVEVERNTSLILQKSDNFKAQTVTREIPENKSAKTWKSVQLDMNSQKFQKKNTSSPSDEEIVKRFLMYSPASISITPPRKLSLSKPPSQAALQALATLRNLKGISTTVVRGKPKNEDDVVFIGGSYKTQTNQNSNIAKRRRTDLPVISSVQSIDSTTPQIVTVQGNVSGFENSWPETSNSSSSECNPSSIRISNVWGSLPVNFMQSAQSNESCTPGCSSRQSNPGSSNSVKKKNTKKTVEYVVLE